MWEVQAKSTEFRKKLWSNYHKNNDMDYVDWTPILHHSTMLPARQHENLEDAIHEFVENTEKRWRDLYDYRIVNTETCEIIPCDIL